MDLVARVERLEKQNRILKWVGMSLAGLLTVFMLTAGFASKEVEAQVGKESAFVRQLTVMDDAGNPALLLQSVQGGGNINIYDSSKQIRGIFAVTSKGPGLSLYDQNGDRRVSLEMNDTTGAFLTIRGPKEAGKRPSFAKLAVTKDGGVMITSNQEGYFYTPRADDAPEDDGVPVPDDDVEPSGGGGGDPS